MGIRVAIDDKAYLRCGTSEGFSRPIHKPVHLSDPEMKFQVPASDYPKSCGYISPGVIMMVNEMDEVESNGDDKYSPADVTISVNCKPKSIYSSDSTNWANNLYANRLRFRDEHELPLHASREEADLVNVPENFIETVIFLRDSLQQFEVMTIQEDFIRVKSGGDHLEREKLRITTLRDRIDLGLMFKNKSFLPVVTKIKMNFDALQNLKNKCENLLSVISSDLTISEVILISYYNELRDMSRAIRLEMEMKDFPKHKAIEVQTSDAGPGVSCHEQITQIRLAEAFQIHNLDLQARIHYAPNDSRSHIAEKVMRSLNEHAGDGTTIPLPTVYLTELESPDVLLNMSETELEELKRNQEEEVALRCAIEVSNRYQNKPCMGTALHSCVPCEEEKTFGKFFFDKEYMEKCHDAMSEKKLANCARSAYFKYQLDFIKTHYILYDGAIEGIRDGCTKSGDKCDFHRNFDNLALLINGWSDIPVERVHPPVPKYDGYNNGFNFHYCKPDEVKQGQFTEKHHLKKEKVQCDVKDRELNDYCPQVQLRKLFESCNLPKLSFEETIHKDGSKTYVPVDANGTKEKIFSQIDEFIKEYTGEDLRNTVMSDVNHYLSNAIEKDVRKRARQEKKSNVMSLTVDEIDWEEMVLSGK